MRLNSAAPPVYFPEAAQSSVLRLGLHPLPLANWLHLDQDFSSFHAHKLQQYARNPDQVSQQSAGAAQAIKEFNDFLLTYLLQHQADLYCVHNGRLVHRPSRLGFPLPAAGLWHSSLWIQDDICLLQVRRHHHVLVAASVCSPSRWRLDEKIGHTVDWIHAPVPDYEHKLGQRVNRLLSGLKPANPVLRFNWSIQPGNELHWHPDQEPAADSTTWYWRVERQTLLKLPASGTVVFGIRLYLHSFQQMEQAMRQATGGTAGFRTTLAGMVQRMPEAMRRYKGLDRLLVY